MHAQFLLVLDRHEILPLVQWASAHQNDSSVKLCWCPSLSLAWFWDSSVTWRKVSRTCFKFLTWIMIKVASPSWPLIPIWRFILQTAARRVQGCTILSVNSTVTFKSFVGDLEKDLLICDWSCSTEINASFLKWLLGSCLRDE